MPVEPPTAMPRPTAPPPTEPDLFEPKPTETRATASHPAAPRSAVSHRVAAQTAASRTVRLHVSAEHPAFAGHFPGQPLLPGVALLAEVLEALLAAPALAAIVGTTPRIGAAKFLAPVLPGARLVLQLSGGLHGVRFELREGERIAALGQFEPAPSKPLPRPA